jgi:hypothetical protein
MYGNRRIHGTAQPQPKKSGNESRRCFVGAVRKPPYEKKSRREITIFKLSGTGRRNIFQSLACSADRRRFFISEITERKHQWVSMIRNVILSEAKNPFLGL